MLEKTIEYKRFTWELNNIIKSNNLNNKLVFLCIGTNTIIGDSFGPNVGSQLKRKLKYKTNIKVIGDLGNIISYNHIQKNISIIKKTFKNSLTIVLDSALSEEKNIGKVFVQNRGLKYAECLKKQNSIIGNVSIKAVVGENKNNRLDNFKELINASQYEVNKMSNIVSNAIVEILE